jgi:hypothetical protein
VRRGARRALRPRRVWGFLIGAALAGLISANVGLAADPEPRGFVRFSRVIAELAERPGFVDALLEKIGRDPAAGGILGREQIEKLRELILGKDWEALDHFPTLSVEEMGRAVRTAGQMRPVTEPSVPRVMSAAGPAVVEESLGLPTGGAPPRADSFLKSFGFGLVVGDALDPVLAPREPDGRRLADLLNRLARNSPTGAPGPRFRVRLGGKTADTPPALVALLREQGHAIEIRDARYFANFGDLTYQGKDVLTPFWVDTGVLVPGQGRKLRVPVAHSQHEVRVDGPLVKAVLSFYFGIDGKTEFRAIATRDQGWTLGRVARMYRGDQALEVVRLAGAIIATYDAIQAAQPGLPFGGYFALGVCNDANALIELAMQGETSLYPLTRDPALFPADTEVGKLARRLPVDGRPGESTDVRRVLATLPVDDLAALPLPDLRRDLEAVSAAYRAGILERGELGSTWFRVAIGGVQLWQYRNAILAGVLIAVLALATWIGSRHRAGSP